MWYYIHDLSNHDTHQRKKDCMTQTLRCFRLGTATITIINTGTIQANLAEWFDITTPDSYPQYSNILTNPIHIPVQCIHIDILGMSILVDACDPTTIAETSFAPPNYEPPSTCVQQLTAIGISPASIDHVIITHGHFDHYSNLTTNHNGHREISFPNAKHYLGKADWEKIQDKLQDPDSIESRTLLHVYHQGLLELIDTPHQLGNSVQLLPAPGDTPGHHIVRIHSNGKTIYCLGDLFHHSVEVTHPEWSAYWSDIETKQHSRQMLCDQAFQENALLIATHIPSIGRLQQTDTGYTWQVVTSA